VSWWSLEDNQGVKTIKKEIDTTTKIIRFACKSYVDITQCLKCELIIEQHIICLLCQRYQAGLPLGYFKLEIAGIYFNFKFLVPITVL
jgi:hypothetical protein